MFSTHAAGLSWPRKVWGIGRETVQGFLDDGVMSQSASLSFYTMLSLAPVLVITIAVVGAVWGEEAARGEVVGQFSSLMGRSTADAVEGIIVRSAEQPRRGTIASIIGVGVLVFGALGVFDQLKSALNAAWEIRAKGGGGVRGWLRSRLLSLATLMTIAFMLVLSLAASAALSAVGGWIAARLSVPESALTAVNSLVSVVAFTGLFAAMYKFLPDAEVSWRDLWPGAAGTAVLFTVGKALIGKYLGQSSTVTVFGAAGSLAMILLWVYYSSILLLLGAEFVEVWTRWQGRPIRASARGERLDPAALEAKAGGAKGSAAAPAPRPPPPAARTVNDRG